MSEPTSPHQPITSFSELTVDSVRNEIDEVTRHVLSSLEEKVPQLEKEATFLEIRRDLLELEKLLSAVRVPRVALVGRRGAGKSSLINALVGQHVADTGHVTAATRRCEWYTLHSASERPQQLMRVLDTYGCQETTEDAAFTAIQPALQDEIPDIVLFLCKAKEVDSAVDEDLRFCARVLSHIQEQWTVDVPVLGVCTMVDELDPFTLYDPNLFLTDKTKSANIATAADVLAARMEAVLPQYHILGVVPTSALIEWSEDPIPVMEEDFRFNIAQLAESILEASGTDARLEFVRGARLARLRESFALRLVEALSHLVALLARAELPRAAQASTAHTPTDSHRSQSVWTAKPEAVDTGARTRRAMSEMPSEPGSLSPLEVSRSSRAASGQSDASVSSTSSDVQTAGVFDIQLLLVTTMARIAGGADPEQIWRFFGALGAVVVPGVAESIYEHFAGYMRVLLDKSVMDVHTAYASTCALGHAAVQYFLLSASHSSVATTFHACLRSTEEPLQRSSALAHAFSHLIDGTEFVDLEIRTGAAVFRAHRIFLLARAPLFLRRYITSAHVARASTSIDVDMPPDTLRALLAFVYTDQVTSDTRMAQRLRALARNYRIPRLEEKARAVLEGVATTLVDVSCPSLARDMRSVLFRSAFADVAFLVEKVVVYAHRCIVASRCPQLRARLLDAQRGEQCAVANVPVKGVTQSAFMVVLEYLYCNIVAVQDESAAEVYHAARILELPRLVDVSRALLVRACAPENACDVFRVGFTHTDDELLEISAAVARENWKSVSRSSEYSALPSETRSALAARCSSHAH